MKVHREVRQMRAHPKPAKPLVGHETTGTLTNRDGSTYRWHQCFHIGASMPGSGEINRKRGWYCVDCGCPADLGTGDDVPDCCEKCKSRNPLRFEEGK